MRDQEQENQLATYVDRRHKVIFFLNRISFEIYYEGKTWRSKNLNRQINRAYTNFIEQQTAKKFSEFLSTIAMYDGEFEKASQLKDHLKLVLLAPDIYDSLAKNKTKIFSSTVKVQKYENKSSHTDEKEKAISLFRPNPRSQHSKSALDILGPASITIGIGALCFACSMLSNPAFSISTSWVLLVTFSAAAITSGVGYLVHQNCRPCCLFADNRRLNQSERECLDSELTYDAR